MDTATTTHRRPSQRLRTQRVRCRIVGLALTGAIVALGACSSDGGGQVVKVDRTPAAVRAAVDKTAEYTRYRMAGTTTMTIDGSEVSVPVEGSVDGELVEMQMAMDAMWEQFGGAPDGVDPGQTMAMVMASGVMYMDMSAFGDDLASVTGGATWMSIDLAAESPALGDVMGTAGSQDPSQYLAFLRGAEFVEEVGREDVRGVTTTHLRGTASPRESLEGLEGDARAAMERLHATLPEGFIDTPVAFDVWVGDDGLVHRYAFESDLSSLDVRGTELEAVPFTSMAMDVEMFDFGADDIAISVPSDDEVFDPNDLLGGSGGFESTGSALSND